MFLTEANVLYYLVDKQFADVETAVSGAFAVCPLTRRNLNFHVTCGTREYLVKQAKGWDFENRASVEREAAFYRLEEAGKRLADLVPHCYAYDPPNSILIFEYLAGYTDLNAAHDRLDPEVGRLCGEAMGAFHQEMESGGLASEFPGRIPWCLSFHQQTEDLAAASAGRRELLRTVQKYDGFAAGLDRLRTEWREDTLIHGDWRFENCLVSRERDRLRVVDWEFVSWGDSIWDVSALLYSYVSYWVRWPSEYPIKTIQPALRAFLNGYAQARGRDPAELTARAIRFGGARMLQAAFDTLEKAEEITSEAVRLLQGSLNIFTRLDWAAEQLIGTPPQNMGANE
jgi:Ser/Thr protein kinase RdoA (MazF antagonist)